MTDFYMCILLDFAMLDNEVARIKNEIMVMIYKLIVKN